MVPPSAAEAVSHNDMSISQEGEQPPPQPQDANVKVARLRKSRRIEKKQKAHPLEPQASRVGGSSHNHQHQKELLYPRRIRRTATNSNHYHRHHELPLSLRHLGKSTGKVSFPKDYTKRSYGNSLGSSSNGGGAGDMTTTFMEPEELRPHVRESNNNNNNPAVPPPQPKTLDDQQDKMANGNFGALPPDTPRDWDDSDKMANYNFGALPPDTPRDWDDSDKMANSNFGALPPDDQHDKMANSNFGALPPDETTMGGGAVAPEETTGSGSSNSMMTLEDQDTTMTTTRNGEYDKTSDGVRATPNNMETNGGNGNLESNRDESAMGDNMSLMMDQGPMDQEMNYHDQDTTMTMDEEYYKTSDGVRATPNNMETNGGNGNLESNRDESAMGDNMSLMMDQGPMDQEMNYHDQDMTMSEEYYKTTDGARATPNDMGESNEGESAKDLSPMTNQSNIPPVDDRNNNQDTMMKEEFYKTTDGVIPSPNDLEESWTPRQNENGAVLNQEEFNSDGVLPTTGVDGSNERETDLEEKTGNFIDFSIGTPPDNNNRNDGGGLGSDPRPSGGSGGGSGTQWEMTRFKNYMGIADVTHHRVPMGIENSAPDFSFFVASNGNVGLGTSYPEAKIHLVGDAPLIRFEDNHNNNNNNAGRNNNSNSQYTPAQTWDIAANKNGFNIYAESQSQRVLPFMIASGAKSLSLVVDKNGNVGMGTDSPAAKLHVLGSARIDGDLNVGPCRLDTNTCQWKRSRRWLWSSEESGGGQVVQDNDDSLTQYLQRLERQNQQAMEMMNVLESRITIMGEMEAKEKMVLNERIKALEKEVAALQKATTTTMV
ncbi:hypothetical protein ACA910_017316 [Epithemia clementina (nom. ined.)]